MKKLIAVVLFIILVLPCGVTHIFAEAPIDVEVPSAILIEAVSGKVLYEKDPDTEHIPASVTKVMTMLLIMEAIDSGTLAYDDLVTASAKAASMGGSQVYLKEGEQFSVTDMLKSITMASANDACVAMAEHIAGSEEAFVDMMNKKAEELGMKHTNFENTNGLDDTVTNHYTSARDIALMSRELINEHPDILKFTSVWMDTVRNGDFGLTNTNRLVRFYKGANGLKTGSTSKAGFCISATAERDGMQLIAVIMKASDRDTRNEAAKKLFDYGFANYSYINFDADTVSDVYVAGSKKNTYDFYIPPYADVIEKNKSGKIKRHIELKENILAPVSYGESVGRVIYSSDDKVIFEDDITASEDIKKETYIGIVYKLLRQFLIT